nr:MAG TPA: hypothetical protein [Caudoviricetes sp.]
MISICAHTTGHALAVIPPFGIIGLRFILSCLRMSPFCERS